MNALLECPDCGYEVQRRWVDSERVAFDRGSFKCYCARCGRTWHSRSKAARAMAEQNLAARISCILSR